MDYRENLPLTKDAVSKFKAGDVVYLTGYLYTARDAAHSKLYNLYKAGNSMPLNFKNQTIFYAGPCPTKPGMAIGSVAATTSVRMDPYVEMCFKLGVTAMIGKGDRSPYVSNLCKKYGGVYFLSIGGIAALIAQQVKSCNVVAYEELGTESIKELYVENLMLIVGIDSNGNEFQKSEIEKYRTI